MKPKDSTTGPPSLLSLLFVKSSPNLSLSTKRMPRYLNLKKILTSLPWRKCTSTCTDDCIFDYPTGDDIWSFCTSTTDTTDDIPGTGRIIDKYFYQPVGRKIEKWIMNQRMDWSNSGHIAGTILKLWGKPRPLSDYPVIQFDKNSFSMYSLASYMSENEGKDRDRVRNLLFRLVAHIW